MYSFRIRYKAATRSPISVGEPHLDLPPTASAVPVRLSSIDGNTPISDSEMHAVVSAGYPTEQDAWQTAVDYRNSLIRAYAKLRIAADFGDRAPQGFFTEAGLRMLRGDQEGPVLNDVHGIMVYPSTPPPRLARTSGAGVALTTDGARLRYILSRAVAETAGPTNQEILAYDLFAASFFESSADARLLMLVMAVETLIVTNPRSASAVAHVDELIRQTESSGLDTVERTSLCNTLSWLRRESIGQAGRRMAKTLGARKYHGMRPAPFFTWAYGIRSALVHGAYPRPSRVTVDTAAASLEVFVSDLLAGDLRDIALISGQDTGA